MTATVSAEAHPEPNGATTPEPAPASQDPNAAQIPVLGSEPAAGQTVPLDQLISMRKRAQEAERKERDARERNAYLEGQLSANPKPADTPKPTEDTEPNVEDFPTVESWEVAHRAWDDRRVDMRVNQALEAREKKRTVATQQQSMQAAWQSNCAKLSETVPDLSDTLQTAQTPGALPRFADEFVNAVQSSEIGPQVLYYLLKNKGEATRLAKLPKWEQIAELGAMRDKIKSSFTPQTRTVTQAPPPLSTVSGKGAAVETDTSDLPMAEYGKRRLDQIHVRRAGKVVPM